MSKEWVYQNFALEFLRLDGHLSLFANIKYDGQHPSWVPDWSKAVTHNRTIDYLFSACGSAPLQVELIKLKTLKLKGIPIDVVSRKMEKKGFGGRNAGSQRFPTRYEEWREFFGRTRRYDDVEEAYWRTLSHDIFVRRGTSIIQRLKSDFSTCARQAAERVRDESVEDFLYSVNRGSGNCALFVTEKGYFGMGCGELEAGDEVKILAGGQLCCILRPTKRDHFELVGQAYVHGLMDGEAVGEKKARGVDLDSDLPRSDWRDIHLV